MHTEPTGTDTCPTCGTRAVDPLHLPRCAHRAALRDDITRRAAAVGIDPVHAADLFAHLLDVYSEGQRAHRAALDVIDLGWRPGGQDGAP